jgi:tetratricopeptide (TPR) repeat protein
MLRLVPSRHVFALAAMACAAFLLASPSYAQTGALKGKVVDGAGKPLDKAVVVIEYTDGINRKYEVKTNKRGEYIQIGLQPGNYRVTASFEKLGSQSFNVRVRLGEPLEVNFVLSGGGAGISKEAAEKAAALKNVFDAGVEASKAGNYDEAIAKFTEASGMVPGCYDCFYNIGYAYSQKKDYEQAEAAFLKAIELKPTYVDAYNGLATVYNAQKKFDKAQEASAKAAEAAAAAGPGAAGTAGGIDAEYNQGVIAWNAGNIAGAKVHFLKVLELNPNHAEAHYQLGMALVNEGKLPEAAAEFETYLKLAPEGPFAATAKSVLAQIKK